MTTTFLDASGRQLYSHEEPLDFLTERDVAFVSVSYTPRASDAVKQRGEEMVYRDGSFLWPFLGSTRAGNVFRVVRQDGWPGDPMPHIEEIGAGEPDLVPLPALPSVLDVDPHYGLNTILLHANGTNGSTTIIDQAGGAWTAVGNAQIITTGAVYGSGALALDGSGDYLALTRASLLGTGNLTVEAWIYVADHTSDHHIFGVSDSNGNFSQFDILIDTNTDGSVRASIRNIGVAHCDYNTPPNLVPVATWTHVAFTVEGTTARTRINGVVAASAAMTGVRGNPNQYARVGLLSPAGGFSTPRWFKGRIDDLRVTKICRYPGAGSVTPPAAQLPSAPVAVQPTVIAMPTVNDAQGVATDGTHVWYSSSTTIYKYTVAGALVTSRNVSADAPIAKNQVNGMFLHAGKLYVSAAKYSGGMGTSYVVEYDPNTLAYQSHRAVDGSRFSEDLCFAHGYWWVVFHAHAEVSQYKPDWSFVATHALSYPITGSSGGFGPGTGYDGVAWVGNYLVCNIHEIYDQKYMDLYAWNGLGFVPVYRQQRPHVFATQGICTDPTDATVFWFALRNPAGDGLAKTVLR